MKKWLKEAKIQSDPDTIFFLVGNQADMEDNRSVSQKRAEEFKIKMKLDGFFETSAKTGGNVEKVFVEAATKLYKMNSKDDDQTDLPELKKQNSTKSNNDNKEFTKLTVDKHDTKADKAHRKKKK